MPSGTFERRKNCETGQRRRDQQQGRRRLSTRNRIAVRGEISEVQISRGIERDRRCPSRERQVATKRERVATGAGTSPRLEQGSHRSASSKAGTKIPDAPAKRGVAPKVKKRDLKSGGSAIRRRQTWRACVNRTELSSGALRPTTLDTLARDRARYHDPPRRFQPVNTNDADQIATAVSTGYGLMELKRRRPRSASPPHRRTGHMIDALHDPSDRLCLPDRLGLGR